jgi:hypothetical protein
MIVYRVGFIDFWNGWRDVCEVFGKIDQDLPWEANCLDERLLLPFLGEALHAAAVDLGWAGDFKGSAGVKASVLPPPDPDGWGPDNPFLLAWKQSNNGETFIASPYRLPWVEADCFAWVDTSEWPRRVRGKYAESPADCA